MAIERTGDGRMRSHFQKGDVVQYQLAADACFIGVVDGQVKRDACGIHVPLCRMDSSFGRPDVEAAPVENLRLLHRPANDWEGYAKGFRGAEDEPNPDTSEAALQPAMLKHAWICASAAVGAEEGPIAAALGVMHGLSKLPARCPMPDLWDEIQTEEYFMGYALGHNMRYAADPGFDPEETPESWIKGWREAIAEKKAGAGE